MRRQKLELAGFIVGLTVLVAGIAQIYVPLAFISAGLMLAAISAFSRFQR